MNALRAPRHQRARTPFGFAIAALLFYIVDGGLLHSPAFATQPNLLAAMASIDLTFGLTFVYWAFVVKPGHANLRTVLPAFLLSVAAAALVLPPGHRDIVRYVRYLGIPVELGAMALLVVAVRRAQRSLALSGRATDVPERIHAALGATALPARLAAAVAMEMSILYYAVATWRRPPFTAGAEAFSYHKRNAFVAILYTAVLASIVETIAVHFVVRAFAPRLALALLALSVFGVVWLIGFARSVQLRPILVSATTLHVRTGLAWSADVARSNIAHVTVGRVAAPPKSTPEFLRASPGQPNVLIELHEPVLAHGPYGGVRSVRRLTLVIDDVARFERTLA